MTDPALFQPPINLPPGLKAFVTTRRGGFSTGPWQAFNLGSHVDDDPAAVTANRALLEQQLADATGNHALDQQWINQVHGTAVHHARSQAFEPPQADALYTTQSNLVCGILTADCLPVLLYSSDGEEIAVAHAGWRGLQKGILENTVGCFKAPVVQISAWLGPAIGPCHFEVGSEVRDAFLAAANAVTREATKTAFSFAGTEGKWLADLYQLARVRLRAAGLLQIDGEPACTFCDDATWYSYRREPVTGRFATMIVKIR